MPERLNVAQPLVQASLIGEAIDRGPALVLVADEDMGYVAVNQHACDVLGYTREELLGLKVTDVARYRSAATDYRAMVAKGQSSGQPTLTRKDGSKVKVVIRAQATTLAGMTLYVAVGWVEASPRRAPQRRRAPARG
jgi:PAS domain S-box-containing protein